MKKAPESMVIEKSGNKVYLKYKGKKVSIGAGSSDHVNLFLTGNKKIFILSINYRLGYVGAEIYSRDTLKKSRKTYFSQDIDRLNENLRSIGMRKKDVLDYSVNSIANWIYQLMYY